MISTLQFKIPEKGFVNAASSLIARVGSYMMNSLKMSLGYLVKSAAIPSVAFEGGVPLRMYFDSIHKSC